MRILFLVPGVGPNSGGPTRSLAGLAAALADEGEDVLVYVHQDVVDCDVGKAKFMRGHGLSRRAVLADSKAIIRSFKPDIIHINALWMPPNHWDIAIARKMGVPVVLSPRGALSPWALGHKRWKKLIAMALYQRRDINSVAALHATAEMEAKHIRDNGFKVPTYIVPNGVIMPPSLPKKQHRENHTALFLSRIHPVKGLLTLAEAWAIIRPKGWRMRVVGPDEWGHKKDVIRKVNELGIADTWDFIDAVDDVEKWNEYRSADLLIHPSVSENFGITIAEGLYAGLPVIATKGTPWCELEEDGGRGWWIDIGIEPLVTAMREAFALDDESRVKMGESGARLIRDKYLWPAIARKMIDVYGRVAAKEG